jgi:hypothetical protein
MRERAPWYHRRIGRHGKVAVVLVVASALVGFATHGAGGWHAVQAALLVGGAAAYLLGLVRSPD